MPRHTVETIGPALFDADVGVLGHVCDSGSRLDVDCLFLGAWKLITCLEINREGCGTISTFCRRKLIKCLYFIVSWMWNCFLSYLLGG